MRFKNRILIPLALMSGMLLLTSCGGGQPASSGGAPSQAALSSGPSQSGSGVAAMRSAPDLYGEVKSVSGNSVTLALLEIPQRQFSGNGGGPGNNGGSGGNGGTGNHQRSANATGQGGNGADNHKRGGNGGSGNGQGGNGNWNGNGQGGNGNWNGNGQGGNGGTGQHVVRNYTGKTETITIPDNIPITTYQRGNNGSQQNKLTLSDIKTGMLLQVWYKKDGGHTQVIDSIRVTQMPAISASPQPTTQN